MMVTMPILSRAFWLLALLALLGLLLGGCDRGGGGAAEPRFDLSGYWIPTEPIDCEFGSLADPLKALLVAVLDNAELLTEEMGGDLEEGDLPPDPWAAVNSEWYVEQTGHDLEITLESGDGSDIRLHGTIVGDQVRISRTDEARLPAFDLEVRTEIDGTVLDEDRMVLTLGSDLTVHVQDGDPVTGGISCTFHAARDLV